MSTPTPVAKSEAAETANSVTSCPICASPSHLYCTKSRYGQTWHIHRCEACGHGFVSNRPTLERLGEIYGKDDESHLEWSPRDVSPEAHEGRSDCRTLIGRLLLLTKERGQSLDVGCGNG